MRTRWAEHLDPNGILPAYPRPQLVRDRWRNLNGPWQYTLTPANQQQTPKDFDGRILVPFCIESALSGVQQPVTPEQALWYRRTFEVPAAWHGQRILLHFGAVDWSADVWLNDVPVGNHRGGYDAFTFDITDALRTDGPQSLVVRVTDPTDASWQPRGKQIRNPHGIWYTAVTGIWQTVWLEPVPTAHIRALTITPSASQSQVTIAAETTGGTHLRLEVLDEERVVAKAECIAKQAATLNIPNAKLWSPSDPHLYDLRISLLDAGRTIDTVKSYCGLRDVAIGRHAGHNRLLLNGEPLFQFGPLDQGWWPDGLYTAPSDAALRYDLTVLKQLNMNMLRKHVKVEPARYYCHCDQLGLLVWQDMPSGDRYIGPNDPDITRSPESAKNFERELQAMIDGLRNHPSIIMWVIYNEGWGQWDTERLTTWVKDYDPTRLVNSASGWTDRRVGDVIDVHAYPGPALPPTEPHRAAVLGEFGGLGWPVADHLWQEKKNWGYRTYRSQSDLQDAYSDVLSRLAPLIAQGLSAAVYTQTTDVEGEVNGLLTYDRAFLKLDADATSQLHEQLYGPPPEVCEVLPCSLPQPQPWRYTTVKPADNWTAPPVRRFDLENRPWYVRHGGHPRRLRRHPLDNRGHLAPTRVPPR